VENTNIRFQFHTDPNESQIGLCFVNVACENAGEFGVHLEQTCQEHDDIPGLPELIISELDVHRVHPDARDIHAVLVIHEGLQSRQLTTFHPEWVAYGYAKITDRSSIDGTNGAKKFSHHNWIYAEIE
jgi:hypothetical protein